MWSRFKNISENFYAAMLKLSYKRLYGFLSCLFVLYIDTTDYWLFTLWYECPFILLPFFTFKLIQIKNALAYLLFKNK